MKVKLHLLIYLSISMLISCSSSENKSPSTKNETTALQTKSTESKDTSFYFVKRLLNASPKEVEKQLGKPDKKIETTKDCFDMDMPKCQVATYQGEKFEVAYYNNRLKDIEIN